MEPITRDELFMAAAAGEYSGELPEPITRLELYWQKIAQRIDAGSSVSPESINTAIADYLNTHDADIVTETELFNALAGKQAVLTAGENITIADNNGNLTISATDTTYSAATTSAAGLMSAADKAKLDGIEALAQVNTVTGVKGNAENDYRTGEINISPANIGLGNVDNTSDANKPISTAAQTALDGKQNVLTFDNLPTENSDNPVKSGGVYSALAGKISTSAKGANGGVAELNANGKVPSSQLPSYVDDVLSYNSLSDFPTSGEDGKIYIAKDTNLSYRWGSSEYVVISPSLALGSTSSTAYRGDWGAEDRAAIGTLTDLQTSAKSSLVGAINELKTASDAKQGTLTFDNAPSPGSTNPVTSGGVYTALAGKAPASHTHTKSQITDLANASASAAGLMSAADKEKLDACKKIVYLASEAAYEALNPPDPDTVYMILE